MYKYPEKEEIAGIGKNLKFTLKSDMKFRDIADDGESVMLSHMYSGTQSFGFTDYKDHRNDSLQSLKEIVTKELLGHSSQRGHYYESDGTPCTEIVVQGYLGGISAVFNYKTGKNGFSFKEVALV